MDKIIIVSNPPYNDTTSQINNYIKNIKHLCDDDIQSRDLGISFLLSYNKLKADYICVLHPLSYIIKRTNFKSLNNFFKNYIIKDSIIVNSNVFSTTSRITNFPIIIALYERNQLGMNYDNILNYKFRTYEGNTFEIGKYDIIDNYIPKYPNHKKIKPHETIAKFWTLRDINALKRRRTFVEKETNNTIRVTKDNFHYYCYIDIFKDYISHIPYNFGNNNIIIDHNKLIEIANVFVEVSTKKYSYLNNMFKTHKKTTILRK